MATHPSSFVWYDVMTTDSKAAEAFYKQVVGWTMADAGMADRPYTLLSAGPAMVGGLMPIPEDAAKAGARPAWMGYIGVDDVDAHADKVKAAGGAIHRPPEDIPNVGRFAVAADPHGASFILFKSASDVQPAPVARGTPGHIGWCELHAGNGDEAMAFYSKLFGWKNERNFEMGPMGTYKLFSADGPDIGGMMTKQAAIPQPFWLYYFNVDGIDAAVERVTKAGGQVLNGPMEVPGDDWIIQCLDPQGAMFALVSGKR